MEPLLTNHPACVLRGERGEWPVTPEQNPFYLQLPDPDGIRFADPPSYPCPEDADGIHWTGCGCDHEDGCACADCVLFDLAWAVIRYTGAVHMIPGAVPESFFDLPLPEGRPGVPGACRGCGCTDERACFDPDTELPCHWAEPGLCSVCAKAADEQVGTTTWEDPGSRWAS